MKLQNSHTYCDLSSTAWYVICFKTKWTLYLNIGAYKTLIPLIIICLDLTNKECTFINAYLHIEKKSAHVNYVLNWFTKQRNSSQMTRKSRIENCLMIPDLG